jgi:hypothetical protein
MNNWVNIISFTYGHEAHLVKSKLESEEIEVMLRDELNAQVCDAGPNAVGGVKLCVRKYDVERATQLLKEGGFIKETSETESGFVKQLGRYTSKIPLIGNLAPELVLIVLIALVATLIFIPLAVVNMP